MRLLVYGLNTAPEPTGTGKFTGEMAAWLAGRGHEVRVVAAPPYYPAWRVDAAYRGRLWRREWRDGHTILRCPLYVPARPRGLTRMLHLASFALSSLPVVLREAGLWRPDLLFAVAPTLAAAPGALLAARLARAPSWLHIQDFEIDAASALGMAAIGGGLAARAERRLLRGFDRVSTISRAMLRRLADKGVAAERSVLFPNWVDCQAIRPLADSAPMRAELGLPPDAIVALYSGNLGVKQGVETLAELGESLPPDGPLHLVVCGAGAAQRQLAERLAGRPRVRLLPLQPAERLNELLNAADLHLLPQRAGAADLVMPSKLTGMLASGRPVVAGAAPGTDLALAVEGCGIVVPPGDSAAMLRAVEELAGDPGCRRDLGAAARLRALAEWDREPILAELERRLVELAR